MFVVASSVEGDIWTDISGIFSTRGAAEDFHNSLSKRWSYELFEVSRPQEYPFFLTNHGLRLPSVRFIEEDELRRLVAEVPRGPRGDRILFNVYFVTEDSVNEVVRGEPVLPKLDHYHIMTGGADFEYIKKYFLKTHLEELDLEE